jgi:TetR/AcrR family transcriptional regulator
MKSMGRKGAGKAPRPVSATAISTAQRKRILDAAERIFAMFGPAGSSLSRIASEVGMSKQHLIYYFSSKDDLYRQVLQNVLEQWWARMPRLSVDDPRPPAEILGEFVHAKFELSRQRPFASKLFAQEIIRCGAISRELELHSPKGRVANEIAVIEHWVASGQIAPVAPAHLLFILWAATQTYADFEAQMCSVLGRESLRQEDFAQGEALLMQLLLGGLGLSAGGAAGRTGR